MVLVKGRFLFYNHLRKFDKAFGLDPIDPTRFGFVVTIENGNITIEKAG